MPADASPGYTVMVDDNVHDMDEDARWRLGAVPTLEDAIAACRTSVEEWLRGAYKPGMSPRTVSVATGVSARIPSS